MRTKVKKTADLLILKKSFMERKSVSKKDFLIKKSAMFQLIAIDIIS